MKEELVCSRCKESVHERIYQYGCNRRFHFDCGCRNLDILSSGSYYETLRYAESTVDVWVLSQEKEI